MWKWKHKGTTLTHTSSLILLIINNLKPLLLMHLTTAFENDKSRWDSGFPFHESMSSYIDFCSSDLSWNCLIKSINSVSQ